MHRLGHPSALLGKGQLLDGSLSQALAVGSMSHALLWFDDVRNVCRVGLAARIWLNWRWLNRRLATVDPRHRMAFQPE